MTNTNADTNSNGAIRETIRKYIEGYLQADGAVLAQAFHHDTRLHSASESGELERTEMQDWQGNLRARKEKGDLRTGDFEIAFIDVAGDSAVAKVVLNLRPSALQFTDYLSLLRIAAPDESGARKWLITGKIYTVSSAVV